MTPTSYNPVANAGSAKTIAALNLIGFGVALGGGIVAVQNNTSPLVYMWYFIAAGILLISFVAMANLGKAMVYMAQVITKLTEKDPSLIPEDPNKKENKK
ncbi:MAG: hypothetical protein BWY98_01123 [Tenericutes bacterium ADurb.BinA155]|jgi:hypothetical protein|nr:MAG: hypothetical protein BWY98_01123 [Tenericutes bacterium ADurb.BinA155]